VAEEKGKEGDENLILKIR